jgi:hypothetical protein
MGDQALASLQTRLATCARARNMVPLLATNTTL